MQTTKKLNNIEILFENEEILVVNKPAGIPIQSADQSQDNLIDLLDDYKDLYIVHRIDQVVSGAVLLARSAEVATYFGKEIRNQQLTKHYLAIVPAGLAKDLYTFERKLFHDKKRKKALISDKGKAAELSYKKLASSDRYDCLEVVIKQGRFHQIRAMLADIGLAIKGDVKYGARRKNNDRSIHLHAYKLAFYNRLAHQFEQIYAPLPSENLWQFFASQLSPNDETTF